MLNDLAQKPVKQAEIRTEDLFDSIKNITGQNLKEYLNQQLENIPSA
ncbi:MAG: hypothetical protein ACFFBD_04180 [Candidatus Hodarchaeota archaeon]